MRVTELKKRRRMALGESHAASINNPKRKRFQSLANINSA